MRELSTPTVDDNDALRSIERVQSRVDAAAFALLREGRNPTVSLVRARMGGGSPNLVAPALQRWRHTFAAQLDDNAGSALELLPPGVLELVQALWSRALFEAHRVRADAPSAATALDQLNAAISELRERSARLQEREAELDAQLRELDEHRRRFVSAGLTIAQRAAARTKKWSPAVPPRRAGKSAAPRSLQRPPGAKRKRTAKRPPLSRRANSTRPAVKRRPGSRRVAPQR